MITVNKHSRSKIVSIKEAIDLIRDNDTVVMSGFVGTGSPDALFKALEERFRETGSPRNLTYTMPAATGDGKSEGLNRICIEGLVKRVIFGHIGMVPTLQKLIAENKVEGYNMPLGVIAHLYRDIAAGNPGSLSHVGLGTFADPDFGGGRMNEISKSVMVEKLHVDGRPYLLYKSFPINVALLRGTTADPDGNVSLEDEALNYGLRSIAAAVHNSGGKVIFQVKRTVENDRMTGRQIHIPSCLVDAVVLAFDSDDIRQTYLDFFNPTFCGDMRVPTSEIPDLPMGERKVIARRAAMELNSGAVINLGIGMPSGVASIAAEEGISNEITLTTEAGVIGGIPCGGLNFGVAYNAEAYFSIPDQFDFYDGGGLDSAFLGLAEVDPMGNVNLSHFGDRAPGFGGAVNISQTAKEVIFMGSFTTGGLEVEIVDGNVRIVKEGSRKKFLKNIAQRTFCSQFAKASAGHVLYVTERCVFALRENGIELIEIAPGIAMDRDILSQMEFRPIINAPKTMDPRIFMPGPMGAWRKK